MTMREINTEIIGAEKLNGRPGAFTPEDGGWSSEDDSSLDEDVDMKDATTLSNEDVVIAVMGVTGAGKSTFISQLTKEEVEVGHKLESCTSEPGVYSYLYKGKTVRLVDTPGFDDTNRLDTDILKDIAFFLSTIYTKKVKLAGIVYLHRITDVRMTGSAFRNLQMLERLCGDNALSRVVVATTMWNLLGRPGSEHTVAMGETREKEYKEKFWGKLREKGSFITRHMGDAQSGESIAAYLLDKDSNVVLDIQREMVDEGLDLDKTAAGKFLQSDHLKMREKYERDLADAQEALEDALKEKDRDLIAQLSKQQEDCKSAIAKADADQSGLQINFTSLVQEKDQQYATLAAEVEAEKKARADEMRFIEHNLREMQDTLERQEKEHQEQMKRMMRSQSAKSTAEAQRMAQLAEQYERQHADMRGQIAAMEEEKRRKSASGMNKLFTWGFWSNLLGDDDHHEIHRPPRSRGVHHHRHQVQRQQNSYYY